MASDWIVAPMMPAGRIGAAAGCRVWLLKSRIVLKPDEVLEKGFDAVALKIVRSY